MELKLIDDIDDTLNTPSPPPLKRNNAILFDEKNKEYIGEPPTSLDFCKTPEYSLIEDSIEEINFNEEKCLNCGLVKNTCICKSNNNITLSNDQETYQDLKDPDDLLNRKTNEIPKSITCVTEPNYQIVFNLPNNKERQLENIDECLTKGQFQSSYGTQYLSEKQYNFIEPKLQVIRNINKEINNKFDLILNNNSILEIEKIKQDIMKLQKNKEDKIITYYEKDIGNNLRKKVCTNLNTFLWNDIYLPECFKTICKQNGYYVKYYKHKNFEIFVNISEKHLIEEDEHNDEDHDFDVHQELDRSIEY